MKLAVLVTEYPKTTETFILRDLMTFIDAGVDLRLYHITPFRKAEILHDFARPTRARARHIPLVGAAALRALGRHPGHGARHGATIVRRLWAEPRILAKSLAMVPQSLALADELADWGAEHIHAEFAGHPATAAWIANAVTGIPYSVSCRAHDIFRTQRLLREKLGTAAAVRTVSDFARRFVLERVGGLDPAAVTVIHSSVDTAALRPLGPPPAAPFHILYVGSLQPRKGVDILLDALAGLDVPNWRATIAGDGPDRATLEALAQERGLSGRVSFLGKQGFDRIAALYGEASVVVAPSIVGPGGRTEGIPNVMIEALALQRPAISTRVSGIPELIRDGETGWLVAPGSVAELRQALKRVQAEPERAYAMACAGRRLVEAEFDLASNAHAQLAIFRAHHRPVVAEG